MTLRKILILSVSAGLSFAVRAEPAVKASSVTMAQEPDTGRVKIAYELVDGPAIVTLDVLDDQGVSLGGAALKSLGGDVNRLVVSNGVHAIWWAPMKSCPDRSFAVGKLKAVVTAWATNAPPDYMVVDLDPKGMPGDITFYPSVDALPYENGVTNDICRISKLVMRKVPARLVKWPMGQKGTSTQRNVTLTEDYYVGVFPITQAQYQLLTGSNPSATGQVGFSDSPLRPVTGAAWNVIRGNGGSGGDYDWPNQADLHDVQSTSFLGKLRALVGQRLAFDLPTEAQWEYACRAGTGTHYANGQDSDTGRTMGWYQEDGATTHPVGLKRANEWGLYDMHGNVFEWCLNWWNSDAYQPEGTDADVTDPKGPTAGPDNRRVIRGGCFNYAASGGQNTSYYRGSALAPSTSDQYRGFRVVAPALLK